jgi:leucyl-tRNA synthetase
MISDYGQMEKKWQEKWVEEGLNLANRDESKPKFMVIFAYPGVTGYLHVGHMRGFSYADAIGRYKRMTGYNVLFPVGTHATGNGSISLAKRIKGGDEGFIDYMKRNGCTDEELKTLTEPMNVVRFFNKVYVEDYWKRFGFLADWRRFTCTLFPDYAKFIQWQFHKLMDCGLLIQKPYFAPFCPNCGPVAVDPSETDLSKGGNAETNEYTLLKFRHGDEFLIAATLRPETVFGQVCFWVDPELEYVRVRYKGETWVISPQCLKKIVFQKDGVEQVGTVKGSEMVGWMCEAPMIHREIPVFPATFVNPNVGTGLVTSVPSDAPDDWISLEALKKDKAFRDKYRISDELVESVRPISIISMDGYGEFPAKDMIDRLGIAGPGDEKLVEAKKQVYKDGYHLGKMKAVCGEFAGMRVEEAKDKMKQAMIDAGEADVFYDLSEEVVCRCGSPVVIKRIDDQWFINYADQALTERTAEHCRSMQIQPDDYYNNVKGVLEWFRERACVRLGNWLGTRFPFDDKWIIEAISDSTLYPLYYTVSMYANSGQITPDQMTGEFFDYVFLGKGDAKAVAKSSGIKADLLEKIRKDVLYWYPLDLNLGGKEHMTVHFPVFLFNHVAILPESMWPRGIMVNWYVTGKKSKISKSKGGAQPIPGAVEKFGVDGMRLYYAHSASPFADIEWDEDTVMSYRQRLDRIVSLIDDVTAMQKSDVQAPIDGWLLERFNTHVGTIRKAMDKLDLRQLATTAYFEMFNDLKWYVRRGGCNRAAIEKVLRTWITAMMPVTPHIAEEMWAECGFEGLVSAAQFPEYDAGMGVASEYGEDLIREVLSDTAQIVKVTGMQPKKAIIYSAAKWKFDVMKRAAKLSAAGKLDIPTLTKDCMSDPELRKMGKSVPDLVKKIIADYLRLPAEQVAQVADLDEAAFLASAAPFMSSELGCEAVVYSADAKDIYDPNGKAKAAIPGRPAIYLE